ncbi:hypothetical protein [Paraburkholderia hayleyella]|uniref:hypothetical protein n=1 Tax=Paraburkholderia hayleyella TaxID=2152889 RepID=UPI0012915B78|nr:hypothetical protein [Paraburkholderia hayleyella]
MALGPTRFFSFSAYPDPVGGFDDIGTIDKQMADTGALTARAGSDLHLPPLCLQAARTQVLFSGQFPRVLQYLLPMQWQSLYTAVLNHQAEDLRRLLPQAEIGQQEGGRALYINGHRAIDWLTRELPESQVVPFIRYLKQCAGPAGSDPGRQAQVQALASYMMNGAPYAHGRADIVQALLGHGCPAVLKANNGRTTLLEAVLSGDGSSVKVLVCNGSRLDLPVLCDGHLLPLFSLACGYRDHAGQPDGRPLRALLRAALWASLNRRPQLAVDRRPLSPTSAAELFPFGLATGEPAIVDWAVLYLRDAFAPLAWLDFYTDADASGKERLAKQFLAYVKSSRKNQIEVFESLFLMIHPDHIGMTTLAQWQAFGERLNVLEEINHWALEQAGSALLDTCARIAFSWCLTVIGALWAQPLGLADFEVAHNKENMILRTYAIVLKLTGGLPAAQRAAHLAEFHALRQWVIEVQVAVAERCACLAHLQYLFDA